MVDEKVQELLRLNPKEKAEKEAIKEFGLTKDFREVGYILEGGKLLDFSGKNQGGQSGNRSLDHREICKALDTSDKGASGDQCLETFTRLGNIRFGMTEFKPNINIDLNVFQTPTEKQVRSLRNSLTMCKNINRFQGEGAKCDLAYDVWNDDGSSCKSEFVENATNKHITTMLDTLQSCKVK